ncbi:hypothetical protein ARAM_007325 [Aspergillus rambellii]|uniref:Peptidyl-prolyl cis-trans isomerase n=1 Tax=Aspergillus rambellii TaxID=308745 RepID=A0A0F8VM56_9EURO|nr:hypothetical protein ARAM_007325 [Aspergillus rambellii]
MSVTLHTTQGDLKVELFCEAVPQTAEVCHLQAISLFPYSAPYSYPSKLSPVNFNPASPQNFIALCASGAYNNTPFHRLVPGFMIQGGDISLGPAATTSSEGIKPMLPFEDIPKGGTSIYHPSALNQEIQLPALRHNTRGILSMASRPVKNQTLPFFVTFAAAPHLDGASTVFGKVLNLTAQDEGGDILTKLEKANVKIDKKGRVVQPKDGETEYEALRINSVTIHANPFAK